MKFKTRLRFVEAVKYMGTPESRSEVESKFGSLGYGAIPMVETSSGASVGLYRSMWLVKNENGTLDVFSDDVFMAQYEPAPKEIIEVQPVAQERLDNETGNTSQQA